MSGARKIRSKLRTARIDRKTRETAVTVEVNIDGSGNTNIQTGLSFLDHLITSIGKHSLVNIKLSGESDDGIVHHLAEDVAIALSQALDKALGSRAGIVRFGYASVPMDESLAFVSIDLVKRQFQKLDLKLSSQGVEGIPREDLEHFAASLLQNLGACTHMVVQYGENDHHKIEAALKAFAMAFRQAASIDPERMGEPPSTKGRMM